MAGHSRPKDGVASACLCPGHPRLSYSGDVKSWMPGTSPGMTNAAIIAVADPPYAFNDATPSISISILGSGSACTTQVVRAG
jgi:hypothetical protein